MTKWMETVKRVYKVNHAKNPNYKFKQAMTDAKKEYKASGDSTTPKKATKRRTKKAKKGKKGKCATGGTRKKRKGSKSNRK